MQVSETTADATAELTALMEEPAHGHNHGRAAEALRPAESGPEVRRWIELDTAGAQERNMLVLGGWSPLHPERHGRATGMTAHRTTLAPGEYVNNDVLRAKVEEAFGFSLHEVRSVYRQGRLSTEQGELRDVIDARLLALSRAGANMLALARLLGLTIKPGEHGGNCRVLDNALARARAKEATA